jgi:hypothetical protein
MVEVGMTTRQLTGVQVDETKYITSGLKSQRGALDARSRFIKLGWQILEHKYRYYILSKPIVNDYQYDMIEKEYEKLAAELGEPPTASDMVDFDKSRPACIAVALKLNPPKSSRRKK